jgi:hypothetical protein
MRRFAIVRSLSSTAQRGKVINDGVKRRTPSSAASDVNVSRLYRRPNPSMSQPAVTEVLEEHYTEAVVAYSNPELFFQQPHFEAWVADVALRGFGLYESGNDSTSNRNSNSEVVLVDLGCGSGRFTSCLAGRLQVSKPHVRSGLTTGSTSCAWGMCRRKGGGRR